MTSGGAQFAVYPSQVNVRKLWRCRMSEQLTLTPDELLTTTRAVRKRLDFTRPVERTVLEECLTIAQQAPTGSNLQN
jgi:hypothetical protein